MPSRVLLQGAKNVNVNRVVLRFDLSGLIRKVESRAVLYLALVSHSDLSDDDGKLKILGTYWALQVVPGN